MTSVPLRLYNREIENLIDRGQFEEAIAHCLHILQIYPKHVATYRLLGKAFLESQRYTEAADIFQRVLSTFPDDFIAHIGMSIIREDEGNLDAAIWHMERAMEVQPSNHAVQDELRRLYGRRDGVEPPRVRITRGALVRMYARGNLYRQAIAEAKAALAEDPNRPDLKILLAKLYFQNGQRIEAVETCSEILNKFPYCYDANRILTQVLPGTSRAEDAEVYLQRVCSLDPYAALTSPTSPNPENVPDNAITIERLVYDAESAQVPGQPRWASTLGIDIGEGGASSQQVPDWLASIEKSAVSTGEKPAGPPPFLEDQLQQPPGGKPTEGEKPPYPASEAFEIPEWMQAAGWAVSATPADEAPPPLEESPEAGVGGLAPADIPDWLRAMAPASTPEEQILPAQETGQEESQSTAHYEEQALPEWLKGISGTPEAAGEMAERKPPTDEIGASGWLEETPSALEDTQEIKAPVMPQASTEEMPDWLSETPVEAPPAEAGEIPAIPAEWTEEAPREEAAPAGEEDITAEWLSSLRESSAIAGVTPTDETPGEDQMQGTAASEATEDTQEIKTAHPMPLAGMPEWADEIGTSGQEEWTAQTGEVGENLDLPLGEAAGELPAAGDQGQSAAWLEGLAAVQSGAGEPLAPEVEGVETPSEWLPEAMIEEADLEAMQPPEAIPEGEVAEIPPSHEIPAVAEKPEAILPAAPEQSEEAEIRGKEAAQSATEIPAWIKALTATEPEESAGPPPSETAPEVLPSWMEEISPAPEAPAEATPIETTIPVMEIPSWIEEIKAALPEEEAPVQPMTPGEAQPAIEEQETVEPQTQASAGTVESPPITPWEVETEAPPEIEAELPAGPGAAALIEQEGVLPGQEKEPVAQIGAEEPEAPMETPTAGEDLKGEKPAAATADIGEMPYSPTEAVVELPLERPSVEPEAIEEEQASSGQSAAPATISDEEIFPPPESPTAEQEAPMEESITPMEERGEAPPEWVVQLLGGEETTAVAAEVPGETPMAETNAEVQAEEPAPSPEDVQTSSPEMEEGLPGEEMPDWLREIQAQVEGRETQPEAPQVSEPAEKIPEWLESVQSAEELPRSEEEKPTPSGEDLPEWLRVMGAQAAGDAAPQPAVGETAHPIEPPAWFQEEAQPEITSEAPPPSGEELPDWLRGLEPPPQPPAATTGVETWSEAEAQRGTSPSEQTGPDAQWIAEEPGIPGHEPAEVFPAGQAEPQDFTMALVLAQRFLAEGNLAAALSEYSRLIEADQFLDNVIFDLRQSVYQHPDSQELWQTLGDAYMHADRLQDALEAYSRAEELLR